MALKIFKKNERECGDSYGALVEDNDDETDLTSLTWLTELRNQNLTFGGNSLGIPVEVDLKFEIKTNGGGGIPTKSNISTDPPKNKSPTTKQISKLSSNSNKTIHQPAASSSLKRVTPAERYEIFLDKIKRDLSEYKQSAISYQTNTAEKPPFNYSHIIGMAMLENGRVTLQQICNWIEEKFAYFRTRKKWNNSIRHNLSLHYCFRKIDRNKFEKGKGGYWELGVDPKKCDRKRVRNRRTNRDKSVHDGGTLHNNIRKRSPAKPKSHVEEIDATFLKNSTNVRTLEDCFINFECEQENALTAENFDQSGTAETTVNNYQQYHLGGTIIINTAEAEISTTNFNFISNSYEWSTAPNGSDDRGTTLTSQTHEENVTMSCVLLHEAESSEALISSSKNPANNLNTLENQAELLGQLNYPVQGTSQLLRPNVIVEHVLQPQNYIFSPNEENLATLQENYPSENGNFISLSNDNFRPYIDGIEEAFQYLRSIEQNNREDILDNILDISFQEYDVAPNSTLHHVHKPRIKAEEESRETKNKFIYVETCDGWVPTTLKSNNSGDVHCLCAL